MFMLGSGILSNLNHKEMAQYWLGMTFWRIVLSAGILGLVMSAINAIAVSLAFFVYYRDVDTELTFDRPSFSQIASQASVPAKFVNTEPLPPRKSSREAIAADPLCWVQSETMSYPCILALSQ